MASYLQPRYIVQTHGTRHSCTMHCRNFGLPAYTKSCIKYVSTMLVVMAGNRCISQLLTLHFIRELWKLKHNNKGWRNEKISTPVTRESCYYSKCELSWRQLHNNAKGEHLNFIYLLKNKLLSFAITISNAKKKLELNLVREMKDLYIEHYKTLPKKLKKAPIKQRHSCYWVIRFKIKTLKLLNYLHIPSNIYYKVLIAI